MSRATTQAAIDAIIPTDSWVGAPSSTKVVNALNEVLGFAAPLTESEALEFLGKGAGATKPTTTIFGTCVIAEVFSIGDEIYFHWPPRVNFNDSVNATINVHWFATGSEVAKTASWDLSVLGANGNPNVLGLTGTVQVVDVAVPATNGDSTITPFVLDAATYLTGNTDFHFRLKRVASSADPVAHPAIEHISITYGANT